MRRLAAILLAVGLSSCGATAQVKIRYTNPATNAVVGACTGTNPLLDLKQTVTWGRIFGRSDSVLIASRTARAGVVDSFTVALQETLWDFWSISYDSTGNPSCQSNIVRLRAQESPSPPVLQ